MQHDRITVDVYEFRGKKLVVFPPDITGVRKVIPVLTSVDCTDTMLLSSHTYQDQRTATLNLDIINMCSYLHKAAIRQLMGRIEEVLICS